MLKVASCTLRSRFALQVTVGRGSLPNEVAHEGRSVMEVKPLLRLGKGRCDTDGY